MAETVDVEGPFTLLLLLGLRTQELFSYAHDKVGAEEADVMPEPVDDPLTTLMLSLVGIA